MIKFPTLAESLSKHHLTSAAAWHDRLVIWTAAAVAGLCVAGFTLLTDQAFSLFASLRGWSRWIPLGLMPLGGVAIVAITRRFAAGAAGSGIPQVMTALDSSLSEEQRSTFVSLRLSILKALLAAAALACGFSIGREGPSVQIAAGVMNAFRGRFSSRSLIHSRDLILAGGAAGIAAAFNAPLAGVVFAIEELSRRFEQRWSGLITTAIIIAGVVSISIFGNYTYFGQMQVRELSLHIISASIVCAILAGLLGGLFSRLLILSSMGFGGFPSRFRQRHPLLFAGLCGLAVAILGLISDGAAHGSGYQPTQDLLAARESVPVVYTGIKFISTWISYWSGIPGGIFSPCLAIGAGLGNDVASLLTSGNATPLIAVGMVGFLAAVTQAPITSFIIVIEMIDGHAMVLSLMASALAASVISRLLSPSLYGTLSKLQLGELELVSKESH